MSAEEIPTYVWVDPGQLGVYLTMQERTALTSIFYAYPRDDQDWTRLVENDPKIPVYMTGEKEKNFISIAYRTRKSFFNALWKLAKRANYLYPDGVVELLLDYWVPGRVSVSSDHDYYPSWK